MAGTTIALRQAASSLVTVLPECVGLAGTRQAFDALYNRLKRKGVSNPKASIDKLCRLIAGIKQQQYDYIFSIVCELRPVVIYSVDIQQTLEELFCPKLSDSSEDISESEIEFLRFLLLLHIRNTECGIYEQQPVSEF